MLQSNLGEMKRAALFVPCTTKDHLRLWIKTYLGLDYDFSVVCDDDTRTPPSNSSPLDFLWEVYQAAMEGTDPSKTFFLAYASRDGFKTLTCAILEVLCLYHLQRDVGHLAAIEAQAQNCASYVKKFLDRPILRDFVTGDNKRTIEITRYSLTEESRRAMEAAGQVNQNPNDALSPIEYAALPESSKAMYQPESNFIRILVATMSGTNSLHVSMLVFDELDLAPAKPVEEAKMISSPGQKRGELPIILMTSTRKFNHGLVQKAIDDAASSGLLIRHWNLIDMARACPPSRYIPGKKLPIYYSEKTLKAMSKEQYDSLSAEEKETTHKGEGYEGCLKNCKIFAMCRGRLAEKQKSNSKLLKSVEHVQQIFAKVETETAKAQLLCWKPSTEGIIYGRFDKNVHMLTPQQMAEKITGDKAPHVTTKAQLLRLIKNYELRGYMGQDYGYSHAFGGVIAFVQGAYCFVVDGFEVAGLEVNEKVEFVDRRLENLGIAKSDLSVFGDTESPSDIKTFKKAGYSMRDWSKKKGSVVEGIDCVRAKLNPIVGDPQLYLLKGDEGCELLAKRATEWHWLTDTDGKLTDVPSDEDDDILDALRYIIMNVFPLRKGKLVAEVPSQQAVGATLFPSSRTYDQKSWMQQAIREQLGEQGVEIAEAMAGAGAKGRKGKLVWSI